MDESLVEKIVRYAETRQLRIGGKLGSGNQGTVFAALPPGAVNAIAIKLHKEQATYFREKRAYERLAQHSVSRMEGFNVPELVYADDPWLVLQMTIVPKPYVLDFGSAYLDDEDEIWEQWRKDKLEMFEDRWPGVEKVISGFGCLGIHLMDIHSRNIAFLDDERF